MTSVYLLELPWSKDSTCRSQIHHIHVPDRMRCSSGDISEEYMTRVIIVYDRQLMQQSINVTEKCRNAADAAIPRTSNFSSKAVQTMVERFQTNKPKGAKEGVGYFQEVPTSANLIAFKRA
ncbi:hypothetical protein TNCV_4467111 [Trichonephila clavipes]|nr:hypothetical protein TNCV_4467111 [Trichonephila clavipes]